MNKKVIGLVFTTVLLLSTAFGTLWSKGLVAPASRSPRTWYVDDYKDDYVDADFTSITAALVDTRVQDGDTIEVYPGRYLEDGTAEITKSLKLIGKNKTSTVLYTRCVVWIKSPDVTIRNFTILTGGRGKYAAIWIEANRTSIRDMYITQTHFAIEIGKKYAIDEYSSIDITGNIMDVVTDGIRASAKVHYSVFSGNTIKGTWPDPLSETNASTGIVIETGTSNKITKNEITGCQYAIKIEDVPRHTSMSNRITENPRITKCDCAIYTSSDSDFIFKNVVSDCITGVYCPNLNNATFQKNDLEYLSKGIYLSSSTNCTIQNNTLRHVSNDGIHLSSNASECLIQDNTLEYIANDGIHFSQATNCTIQNNTLRHVSNDGIHLYNTSQCTIKNNFIYDGNQSGISLVNSDSATILENTICRCCYCGVHVREGCNDYVIYHNDFFDNGFLVEGIQALDEARTGRFFNKTLEEGNYWSDFQGEDTDGDEYGDPLIAHHGLDPYPRVAPIGQIPVIRKETTVAGEKQERIYYFSILLGGYMTLSMFKDHVFDQAKKSITFDITLARIVDDCNITVIVPNELWTGAFEACIDNIDIPFILSRKENYYSICFDLFSLKSIQNIRIEAEANYPDCDINNDGRVDIFDVVIMVTHYGEES